MGSGLRTKTFTITEEGRDKGKSFLISEMPAEQAEMFGLRALLVLTNSGIDVPDDIRKSGMAGLAVMGYQALTGKGIQFEDVKPLFEEQFACIQFLPDPAKNIGARPLYPTDIEEVWSRVILRKEWFELQTGFSLAGAASTLTSETAPAGSPNTQTSPQSSAP